MKNFSWVKGIFPEREEPDFRDYLRNKRKLKKNKLSTESNELHQNFKTYINYYTYEGHCLLLNTPHSLCKSFLEIKKTFLKFKQ